MTSLMGAPNHHTARGANRLAIHSGIARAISHTNGAAAPMAAYPRNL